MISKLFQTFIENLKISNREEISTTYKRITTRLNKDFHDSDSETLHSLQVGSFGRRTAIGGISDLDMLFELSSEDFDRINARVGNGQSALLQEVKSSLLELSPRTEIKADGPVVVVPFKHHDFEVLPAFLQEDGSYLYGNTSDGGSWEATNPRAERDAFDDFDTECNGNVRRAAKMLRAWKNNSGAPLGGWLIDALAYRFFEERLVWRSADLADYPELLSDLFHFLADLDEEEEVRFPGSDSSVARKGSFLKKASDAAEKCDAALAAETLLDKSKKWKAVFGFNFQMLEEVSKSYIREVSQKRAAKEEFIEEEFPVDIQYNLKIDYEVTENSRILFEYKNIPRWKRRLPTGNGLRFYVVECSVPEPYKLRWKVKNRGVRSRGQERGEIVPDGGRSERVERTSFSGNHYVEAYVIKDDVCVARDRAPVPIVE